MCSLPPFSFEHAPLIVHRNQRDEGEKECVRCRKDLNIREVNPTPRTMLWSVWLPVRRLRRFKTLAGANCVEVGTQPPCQYT